VPDGIACEPGKRGRPIRYILSADRTQREQIIESEREITPGHVHGGEREVAPVGCRQRVQHLAGIDGAQNAIEHDRRNRDNRHAQDYPDSVPADPRVAKDRRPMQGIEHPVLAVRFRLHRSVHQAIASSR